MKRFLLFAWTPHEASGGWNDLSKSADTLSELVDSVRELVARPEHREMNWEVVDQLMGVEYDTLQAVEAAA